MPNASINNIIPYFSLASIAEQQNFLDSEDGKRVLRQISVHNHQERPFYLIVDNLLGEPMEWVTMQVEHFEQLKFDEREYLKDKISFLRLNRAMNKVHLDQHIFGLVLLTPQQRASLFATPYSTHFLELALTDPSEVAEALACWEKEFHDDQTLDIKQSREEIQLRQEWGQKQLDTRFYGLQVLPDEMRKTVFATHYSKNFFLHDLNDSSRLEKDLMRWREEFFNDQSLLVKKAREQFIQQVKTGQDHLNNYFLNSQIPDQQTRSIIFSRDYSLRFFSRDFSNQSTLDDDLQAWYKAFVADQSERIQPVHLKINAGVAGNQARLELLNFDLIFLDPITKDEIFNTEYSACFFARDLSTTTLLASALDYWIQKFNEDQSPTGIAAKQQIEKRKTEFLQDAAEKFEFLFGNDFTHYQDSAANLELFYQEMIRIYSGELSIDEKKIRLKKYFNQYLNNHSKWGTLQFYEDITLKNSVAFIIRQFISTKKQQAIKEHMRKVADAHMFYNGLGLSSHYGTSGDYGTWLLDYLDFFNDNRAAENISQLKKLMYAFLRPVQPFFDEYVHIAKHEKNTLKLLFGATMPILVLGVTATLLFSLMVPFAMHAILEIFMLIPVLYIGMIMAAGYVQLKDYMTFLFTKWYYGDVYKSWQFDISPRLITALGKDNAHVEETAQLTRDYYVHAMKYCDELDTYFTTKKNELGLTEMERTDAEENRQRSIELMAEWYDVSQNKDVDIDQIRPTLQQRLKKDGIYFYSKLKRDFEDYIDHTMCSLEKNKNNPQEEKPIEVKRNYWPFFKPEEPDPWKKNTKNSWMFFKQEEADHALGSQCKKRVANLSFIEQLEPRVKSH